jgi:hypothetical protein
VAGRIRSTEKSNDIGNFVLMEIIKHDHKIHNVYHELTLTEFLETCYRFLKWKTIK